jgi:tetratricopeptide (TPR) repeat protein
LERVLVARESLLEQMMACVRESATTGNKHQRLVIGPRGMGKTHLITVLHNRILADADLVKQLCIVRLNEDPYMSNYADLLYEMVRALSHSEPSEKIDTTLEQILEMSDATQRERCLEQLLLDVKGEDRTLLLIAENLDDIMDALKKDGQSKLRAFVQNSGDISMVASTTSLTYALTNRDAPFFGFFRETPLKAFSPLDAVSLLAKLAEHKGDEALAKALRSPTGIARIRAVHHLAGGNPRIYVLFFDFLSCESLDDLVEPLMKLMDDLTPYYQSHMKQLSPVQRRLLDTMRRQRGAIKVGDLAKQTMNTPQSVSTQLGRLRDLGYVEQRVGSGRSNYYELREPLMRLCLEVKEQRGRSLSVFVEFLRVWYADRELDQMADAISEAMQQSFMQEAIKKAREEADPVLRGVLDQVWSQMGNKEYQAAMDELLIALERSPENVDLYFLKFSVHDLLNDSLKEKLECLDCILRLDPENIVALVLKSQVLRDQLLIDQALNYAQKAVRLDPESLQANYALARFYDDLGDNDAARPCWEVVSRYPSKWPFASLRFEAILKLQKSREAIELLSNIVTDAPEEVLPWLLFVKHVFDQTPGESLRSLISDLIRVFPASAGLNLELAKCYAYQASFHAALLEIEKAKSQIDQKDRFFQQLQLEAFALQFKLHQWQEMRTWFVDQESELELRVKPYFALLHAAATMLDGAWQSGEKLLADLLAQTDDRIWVTNAMKGLVNLDLKTDLPEDLAMRYQERLLAVYAEQGKLPILAKGVIRALAEFANPSLDAAKVQAWCDRWLVSLEPYGELAFVQNIIRAASAYAASRDQQHLEYLSAEERGLLEPWFLKAFDSKAMDDLIDQAREVLNRLKEKRNAEQASDTEGAV